jgi:hypothetical protein
MGLLLSEKSENFCFLLTKEGRNSQSEGKKLKNNDFQQESLWQIP